MPIHAIGREGSSSDENRAQPSLLLIGNVRQQPKMTSTTDSDSVGCGFEPHGAHNAAVWIRDMLDEVAPGHR